MKMKKIVVYSHDTFGLGNIRRMLAITQHLLDEHADLSVLLITGSPVIHNLPLPTERFDYIKLPCLARDETGRYDVKQLDIKYENVVSLRAQTIKISIQKFNPDLVLVDKKPCGVANELVPALQSAENPLNKTPWVLLLRDILDTPSKTKRIWRKNAYNAIIERFYQRILVVGSAKVFDMRREYAFSAQLYEKTEFCGYLHRPITATPDKLSQIRQRNDKRTVLVTPGGGEDGYQLIKQYLRGLRQQALPDGFTSLIVTGPEMSAEHRQQVQLSANQLANVEVKTFTANLPAYMHQSSLVVCMAGYNTLCEILSLNKAAIVVPRVKPVQEQLIRAERFAELGLLRSIHPDQLSAKGLIDAVHQELNHIGPKQCTTDVLNFNGLMNISASIRGLLEQHKQANTSKVSTGEIRDANKAHSKDHLPAKNLSKNLGDVRITGNTCPAT